MNSKSKIVAEKGKEGGARLRQRMTRYEKPRSHE
jgi:hypothetical protein